MQREISEYHFPISHTWTIKTSLRFITLSKITGEEKVTQHSPYNQAVLQVHNVASMNNTP